ncbi:protein of unknown function [Candidatus Filomicrobium marinum]|uniref:Crp/Fnr family transcriptional regulator n=2 Tax=Filomicrobium TaxID=119044 RepID=A0A0D6JER3_9HYPH|nr:MULTISPECIES: Crp/Fnr family transcriptional regulator [Filomicrobium]MCV0367922.1 Crp/Fnr family transcriptional regulator [Filomicrobium sp.]CFX17968.1 protein of unknown function [Candidatus Filomicrobium marinum]CPR18309.1 protein of unknown function [Candidatus Filomicrobium marinum]SDO20874.1 cAMP-binding domain of CRP or a regulatory subunit of cAMP-dependent protein kinases [Filomicrobium insigne]
MLDRDEKTISIDPQDIAVLPDLSVEAREALFRAGELRILPAGSQLFEQESTHTHTSLILDGLVRVYYVSPSGKESTLSYWSAGDLVGGPDLFERAGHVWSGKTLSRTRLLSISGERAGSVARAHPEVLWWFHRSLTAKLRWVSILYQLLGTENVRERLARLLLLLCESYGEQCGQGTLIRYWVNQGDIATLIGSSRQWTNRGLQDFRRVGLIDIQDRHIIVIDIEGLQDLIEADDGPCL